MIDSKKILVIGIGSLGGIVSFNLLKNNYSCILVTNNDTITKAINENGLSFKYKETNETITATAQTNLPDNEHFDFIFIMTKTNSIEKVSQDIKSKNLLKPDGLVITVQNGNVYDFIKDEFPSRIVTSIIGWNAVMTEPGKYELKTMGKTYFGDITNQNDLSELNQIMQKISPGDVVYSKNMLGHVWTKLAITSGINSLGGITGLLLGEWAKLSDARKMFVAVFSETIDLAKLQQIKLEKTEVSPDMFYIPKKSSFVKKTIKINAVKLMGKKVGAVKVSMLQDIERGRHTEIDFLNGYLSNKGKELNFATPVNDRLTELIKSIEDKKIKPGTENLFSVEI